MSIRVDEAEHQGTAILLGERFDFEQVGPFRNSYESITNAKNNLIVIDFRDTRYIDSSALGMLINAKSYFKEKNVKIKLANANEQVRKIFSITRFDKKFDIL